MSRKGLWLIIIHFLEQRWLERVGRAGEGGWRPVLENQKQIQA